MKISRPERLIEANKCGRYVTKSNADQWGATLDYERNEAGNVRINDQTYSPLDLKELGTFLYHVGLYLEQNPKE